MLVAASNRVGTEKEPNLEMAFCGSSFIGDHTGAMLVQANRRTRPTSRPKSTSTPTAKAGHLPVSSGPKDYGLIAAHEAAQGATGR